MAGEIAGADSSPPRPGATASGRSPRSEHALGACLHLLDQRHGFVGVVILDNDDVDARRAHLQAACLRFEQLGEPAVYLPLAELVEYGPNMLDNLEQLDLVCLDNIGAVAGDSHWQVALFDLYNRLAEHGKKLIIVADDQPTALGFTLPDLVSRLQACTVFQLRLLSDDDKQKLLQQKARVRGLDLPDEVARYLLNRQQRDIRALVSTLDILDKASMVHQRRLTIPFVKDVLSSTFPVTDL